MGETTRAPNQDMVNHDASNEKGQGGPKGEDTRINENQQSMVKHQRKRLKRNRRKRLANLANTLS